eukprot:jgi/Chlat1/6515/Chrsp45S05994
MRVWGAVRRVQVVGVWVGFAAAAVAALWAVLLRGGGGGSQDLAAAVESGDNMSGGTGDLWWRIGCFSGAMAVGMGAFGAHGLRKRISDPRMLTAWDTGAHYQLLHSVMLLVAHRAIARPAGLTSSSSTAWPPLSYKLFLAGVALFSGSLYAYVLTGQRKIALITPFGGFCFVLGWMALAAGS